MVNNVALNIPADIALTWAQVKDEFNLGKSVLTGINPRIFNLRDFGRAFFISPLRLNLKCNVNESDSQRYLSGLDSRASTVNVLWAVKGSTEANKRVIPQIWAGCTSVLRLSPGRVIDLIQ
jgi:hypothetical protein